MKFYVSLNLAIKSLLGLVILFSIKYIYDGKTIAEETLKIRLEENRILEVALIQCRNRQPNNNSVTTNTVKWMTQSTNNFVTEKFNRDKRNLIKYLITLLKDSPYPGIENYTQYTVARLGMSSINNVKPLKPEFGPVINDVLSFRYPINIPSCPDNISSNKSVFIALISAPAHFQQRNDIRQTWNAHLKNINKNVMGMARIGFFLGLTTNVTIQNQINEESKKHGDVVQIEMNDSYRNLTLKSIAVLNWVRQHCAKVDLLFKVDDDVYVNVNNLVHFVRSNYQSNGSLFGYPNFGYFPIRMELGYDKGYAKWDMTYEEYPWGNFPNYVNGPAYLMHGSVVVPLLAASQTTPLIPFEDVFLTGMCTEKAGIKMQYSEGNPRYYNSIMNE
jgi:hypothetical protein